MKQHATFAVISLAIVIFFLDLAILNRSIFNFLADRIPTPLMIALACISGYVSLREYRKYKKSEVIGYWEFYVIARLAAGAIFFIFAAWMLFELGRSESCQALECLKD